MPLRSDIPHLLALIDDETSWIRKQVLEELKGFGPSLMDEIGPYFSTLSPTQKQHVSYLIEIIRHEMMYHVWPNWLDEDNDQLALELAFSQLEHFCTTSSNNLESNLDELAIAFQKRTVSNTAANLMKFLFHYEGFRPPDEDAQNPKFNCLSHVIKHRQGSQIALSVLAILLGRRLGIELFGLHVPGHFVLVNFDDKKPHLYNTFNHGETIAQSSVLYIKRNFDKKNTSIEEMLVKPHQIILQLLGDSIESYSRRSEDDKTTLFTGLYNQLIEHIKKRNLVG